MNNLSLKRSQRLRKPPRKSLPISAIALGYCMFVYAKCTLTLQLGVVYIQIHRYWHRKSLQITAIARGIARGIAWGIVWGIARGIWKL
jgi:hypothetical protein